jgi:hypothetical protein
VSYTAPPVNDPLGIGSIVDLALERKFEELADLLGARPPAKLLNRAELSQWLGVSVPVIRQLEDEGLPILKLGECIRYSVAAVENWLASRNGGAQ